MFNIILQKISGTFKPNENWGPKNAQLKQDWLREEQDRQLDRVLNWKKILNHHK